MDVHNTALTTILIYFRHVIRHMTSGTESRKVAESALAKGPGGR